MIKITVSTTLTRRDPIIKDEASYTPAQAIADAGFGDVGGSWMANGHTIPASEMNTTFAQLGYSAESGRSAVSLTNVVKADNA